MRSGLIFLTFMLLLVSQGVFADKNRAPLFTEPRIETGSEKSENQKPKVQEKEISPIPQGLLDTDSTANTVKFNYLFYLIYKLKYGQEPPTELIDTDI